MSAAIAAPVTLDTPPVSAPLRPYTHRLLDVLRIFARCRGQLSLESRPLGGGGAVQTIFSPPIPAVPLTMLDGILANDGIRVGPVTRSGTQCMDLAAAFVIWRLGNRFERRHEVPPEDHATVAAALANFPLAPGLLIDAGPEVVALWPLDRPLPVDKDPARAVALLTRLATRLGADADAAKDLAVSLPLAGAVRNWNKTPPDLVDLVDVAPGPSYTVEDLNAALDAGETAEGGTR